MSIKVKVDKEKCIGCQTCTIISPHCFEMDGNVAKEIEGGHGEADCNVQEAAEACPVAAIVIED